MGFSRLPAAVNKLCYYDILLVVWLDFWRRLVWAELGAAVAGRNNRERNGFCEVHTGCDGTFGTQGQQYSFVIFELIVRAMWRWNTCFDIFSRCWNWRHKKRLTPHFSFLLSLHMLPKSKMTKTRKSSRLSGRSKASVPTKKPSVVTINPSFRVRRWKKRWVTVDHLQVLKWVPEPREPVCYPPLTIESCWSLSLRSCVILPLSWRRIAAVGFPCCLYTIYVLCCKLMANCVESFCTTAFYKERRSQSEGRHHQSEGRQRRFSGFHWSWSKAHAHFFESSTHLPQKTAPDVSQSSQSATVANQEESQGENKQTISPELPSQPTPSTEWVCFWVPRFSVPKFMPSECTFQEPLCNLFALILLVKLLFMLQHVMLECVNSQDIYMEYPACSSSESKLLSSASIVLNGR